MSLLVLDIGGTYIKYNIWNGRELSLSQKINTPDNYLTFKTEISKIINQYDVSFRGIAISAPGNFNPDIKEIKGISAVQYLHHFPIINDLENTFNLPVTIENDANCAGLCEVNMGIAKDYNNVACIVLGTGVGGSLFFNGELYRGVNNRGSEFGFTKNSSHRTLSSLATIVKVANKYEQITGKKHTGEEIYNLFNKGDQLAIELINDMYDEISLFIYNLQVILDLDLIVIGGGVSAQPGLAESLLERVKKLLFQERIPDFFPEIKTSKYKNDANLLGAIITFEKTYNEM